MTEAVNEQLVDAIVGSYCCMCGGRGPYPRRLISPFEPVVSESRSRVRRMLCQECH